MASQKAGEARQMEIQAKNQSDLSLVDAKSKAKMAELEKEAEVKLGLMQKEFEFNMQLQGIQVGTKMQAESQKEDRKDSRQDRANTQQSELIDQRQKNSRPKNFESSEDNISGSIELGEMTPS